MILLTHFQWCKLLLRYLYTQLCLAFSTQWYSLQKMVAPHVNLEVNKKKWKQPIKKVYNIYRTFQRNCPFSLTRVPHSWNSVHYTNSSISLPQSCFMNQITLYFKFATSHKNLSPSMPTWLFNSFFIRMNPWKFGEYQFKTDKVIQHLLKPCTFYTL